MDVHSEIVYPNSDNKLRIICTIALKLDFDDSKYDSSLLRLKATFKGELEATILSIESLHLNHQNQII